MWILSKICKHLILHLWHTRVTRSIHLHIWHHAWHTELLLVKSIHHSCVWRESHREPTVCSTCSACTALGRQIFHKLLRIHLHELSLHHQGQTVHFLEVLLIANGFQESLCVLWTLSVISFFTLEISVFFLGFSQLRFQTLLFTLLLFVFFLKLFHFFLEFAYLTHVLVSLLLKFLDLFFFISKLHFQAFVLVLGTVQIFLQFGHLIFKLILFT